MNNINRYFTGMLMAVASLIFVLGAAPASHAAFASSEMGLVEHLNEILSDASANRKKLNALKLELETAANSDKEDIQDEIDRLRETIADQKNLFTKLLSGGSTLEDLETVSSAAESDWQKDLTDIMQPVFAEISKITQEARREELLRQEIHAYQDKIKLIKQTLKRLELVDTSQQTPFTNGKLEDYKSYLEKLAGSHEKSRDLLAIQLQQVVTKEQSAGKVFVTYAQESGLSLLVAFLMALAVFSLFAYGSKRADFLSEKVKKKARFQYRLASILMKVGSVVFAWVVFLVALYVFQQWLAFGLVALITAVALISMKDKLPDYMTEVRIMLNMGPIKEGERIVYNDLAWRINRISLLTEIENPALNVKLQVPLSHLSDLYSRSPKRGEGWYPTSKGDTVLTHDGRVLEVVDQNVEYINLLHAGSTTLIPATEFPSLIMKNLSSGYGIATDFGLDYDLQSVITSDVIAITDKAIGERLPKAGFAEHVDGYLVDFGLANASSLDMKIIVRIKGSGASEFFGVQRWIQKTMVDICNENNWGIPFAQMVVHKAEEA